MIPVLGSCSQFGFCQWPSWKPRQVAQLKPETRKWETLTRLFLTPPSCPPCTTKRTSFLRKRWKCKWQSWPHKPTWSLIQTWVHLTPRNFVSFIWIFHRFSLHTWKTVRARNGVTLHLKFWKNPKSYIWTQWVRASEALLVLPPCLTRPRDQVLVETRRAHPVHLL